MTAHGSIRSGAYDRRHMERPPLDRTEFDRWRSDAERAVAGARAQRDAGIHNWACFLSEQGAQLAVKGLLHGLGAAPWGHDPVHLADLLVESGVQLDAPLRDALVRLGRAYIASRYPDAHAAGGAGPHYTASDSDAALRDAEEILAFVDRTWRELGG